MQNSNGSTDLPVTGPVVVLDDDPATADVDESLGCAASDYAAVQPGDIAVTYRGVCARVDRAILGQAAGAAAVVMINNEDILPPYEGSIAGVTIPFLGAKLSDEAAVVAAAGQTVTIEDAGEVPNPNYTGFAGFSSGGPRNGDSAQKPDVIAPGVSIISTLVGSGTGSLQALRHFPWLRPTSPESAHWCVRPIPAGRSTRSRRPSSTPPTQRK